MILVSDATGLGFSSDEEDVGLNKKKVAVSLLDWLRSSTPAVMVCPF